MLSATTNQLIAIGKKGVGVFLFIICSVAIYREVGSNENIVQYGAQIKVQFEKIAIYQWAVLFILMLLNFLVESLKWKIVLHSETSISMPTALKSVFVGQAFAFYTPNRIGEYVGRTMMLDTDNKIIAIGRMAWASYAQMIVTIIMGAIAIYINPPFLPWLRWATPLLMVFALIVYFHKVTFSGILKSFNFLQIESRIKRKLLALSFLRYSVFLLQYTWAAHILNIPIPYIVLWVALAVMFLSLSIVPTISITELVIRGQLILLLLSPWYQNSLMLISLSTLIWAVNFLLPAIIGAFLLLGFRLKQ
ncbi:MAG: hypothetical protein RL387_718 [Bacteroidota bacterium]|jgi:uncharacterized membrane protein YbhN (UPF0104 family)